MLWLIAAVKLRSQEVLSRLEFHTGHILHWGGEGRGHREANIAIFPLRKAGSEDASFVLPEVTELGPGEGLSG